MRRHLDKARRVFSGEILSGVVPAQKLSAHIARAAFWALLAALALLVVSGAAPVEPALAQDVPGAQDGGGGGGGEGDAIVSTVQNATQYLSDLMFYLGALGFVASLGVKAVARTNENMHHASHMGMTGSAIAVAAGIIVPEIIDIVAGFAGG